MILVGGFMYDMLGRKWTVFSLFVGMGISIIAFPLYTGSVIYFDVIRVSFQLFYVPLLCIPFVNDYVRVQSRGKATGI